jgi:DNA-binding PadR family transcriptional regulator
MDGMMLEIFVLSVLRTGPVHGYELKRRVQRPSFATLSNNSLYPMLRRSTPSRANKTGSRNSRRKQ